MNKTTKTYIVRDREAGNIIDEFDSLEAAEAALVKYEEEDRRDGTFEEDFYEVATVEPDESFYAYANVYDKTLKEFASRADAAAWLEDRKQEFLADNPSADKVELWDSDGGAVLTEAEAREQFPEQF